MTVLRLMPVETNQNEVGEHRTDLSEKRERERERESNGMNNVEEPDCVCKEGIKVLFG